MKLLCCLAVIALLSIPCISYAEATAPTDSKTGWVDDFENYECEGFVSLTAPWEDAASQGAYWDMGYKESQGAEGPGYNWYYGHAWRPITVGQVLVAKMRLEPTTDYQSAKVGLVKDKSFEPLNGCFTGANSASLTLHGDASKKSAILVFGIDSYKGEKNSHREKEVKDLVSNVWYDVRLKVEGRDITAEYKPSDKNEWISVGKMRAYDGFEPKYVGISGLRGGYLDDVGYTTLPPEKEQDKDKEKEKEKPK